MTVRPDGENAFGQISEIRQVYEIGELNNELFIEVADNKDLTLSVDEPRLNTSNESAVVLEGTGTLHFSETDRETKRSISSKGVSRTPER